METTRIVEITVCDYCRKDDAWYNCLGCGKTYCYDCIAEIGVKYNHGVYVSGHGDGFYCNICDVKCQHDELHKAYNRIKILKNERETFYKFWEERKNLAEKQLQDLLKTKEKSK